MKSIAKSDPVHKVSVVSRGQALGITIQLPLKDRYLTSKSELMARMAAAVGGRAAEKIVFGDVTTGAKQDIEAATSIARQMVCEFGMSERLGLVTLHRKGDGDNLFFSELTAADVDAEIKALTDAAYRQASDICTARRATLVHRRASAAGRDHQRGRAGCSPGAAGRSAVSSAAGWLRSGRARSRRGLRTSSACEDEFPGSRRRR